MSQGIYVVINQSFFDDIYGPEERAAIRRLVPMREQLLTPGEYRASGERFPGVDLIFASWGMMPMDETFFGRFPDLRWVFYAAGSIRPFVTDLAWKRGVRLSSAFAANAVPVSEFTLAQIFCALKQTWQQARYLRQHRQYNYEARPAGAYRTTVGLVSLGMIGRLVAERLKPFDLRVVAYDPFATPAQAAELGVTLCPLEEVFAVADVVSCHAPLLPQTEKMLGRPHFESMKPGATFLNTSRGRVVDEAALIEVLKKRPDLFAILDVTAEEPPARDSALYTLDNVVLTPHMAGSQGGETRRLGALMVEEFERLRRGEPLRYEITEGQMASMA